MAAVIQFDFHALGAPQPRIVGTSLRRTTACDFDWTNVQQAPFDLFGLIACRRPSDRKPFFNISQRFSIQRNCEMHWRRPFSPAVETLALHVLLALNIDRNPKRAIDLCYREAHGRGRPLVQLFAEENLMTLPATGGCIPLESLTTWCEAYMY